MSSISRKSKAGEAIDAPPVARARGNVVPTVDTPFVPASLPKPPRLDSVDILRGIIMVIMALDHVRDYFTNVRFDPLDLTQTSAALFFTRLVTHFCAPVFVFLAGTGAFLSVSRGKPMKELTRFLWTRGVFLVVMELTVVRFAWLFNFSISLMFVQVIWAIGVSMICLAGLVRLRLRTIAIIGIAMIVGHNALDGVTPETFGALGPVWIFLHIQQPIPLSSSVTLLPFYPLIPWIGVMAAGYAFGSLLRTDPGERRKILFRLGFGLIAAFVIIRSMNIYGDLHPWTSQKDTFATFLSFLNVTKYPPSLDFLLMTLGPAIVALALFEKGMGKIGSWFVVYGRVPMFYYIIHLYAIHALVLVVATIQGFDARTFLDLFIAYPQSWGFDLTVVYLIWIGVVVSLYPLCKWYGGLKRRRKDVWLSYL
jgi:uncharacterized membrane protein